MAELGEDGPTEGKKDNGSPKRFGFNPLDPSTPDVYANNLDTIIGASEISLVFGHNIDPGGEVSRPLVRVTLTHSNFLILMGFLNKRVNLLERLYSGTPYTLDTISRIDPAEVTAAFDEMYDRVPASEDKL